MSESPKFYKKRQCSYEKSHWGIGYAFTNGTIYHENVQKLIQNPNEHFDAVLVQWFFSELLCGFAAVFNCPYIWVHTMDPINVFSSLMQGLSNPAYTTTTFGKTESPFAFWQRVEQLYNIVDYYYIWWSMSGIENETYNKGFSTAVAKRGRVLQPYDVLKYNASLAFDNSIISTGGVTNLPQSYKPIGGIHIQKIKSLPDNLQKIMDDAKYGVIYFSFGSVIRSVDMADDMKKGILEMFSDLNQTIIWKYEGSLLNIPKNVHIIKWTPQISILAHKNCRLFISHGGQSSSIEAVHFGIPIIGTPVFGDQFSNINKVVFRGCGLRVDFGADLPYRLHKAINEVLQNPKYMENAKENSAVYHHRLVSPGQELVYWVEHVIITHGAPHLRSASLDIPLYQKLYIDLIATIIVIVFVLKMAIVKLFRFFKLMVKKCK